MSKYQNILNSRPPGKTWLYLKNVLNGEVYCGKLSNKPVVVKKKLPDNVKPMHFKEKSEHGRGAFIIATHFINP